jgi:type VI protein secretion system component Hcp
MLKLSVMTIAKLRCEVALGVVAVLCAGIPLPAQSTTANLSSSVLTVAGIACSTPAGSNMSQVSSWSWGESFPPTVAGGAGKVNLADFTVTKNFDGCSPKLAQAGATGQHLTTVTLHEYDNHQNLLLTVVLTTAILANYQLMGSSTTAAPAESVTFAFQQIQITDNANNTSFCFNAMENKTC